MSLGTIDETTLCGFPTAAGTNFFVSTLTTTGMADLIVIRTVTVKNPKGLHARPAYMFAELAGKYAAKIEIIKENERVDGKSILSIMTLAAGQGTALDLEAVGQDAEDAIDALAELFEHGFPSGEEESEST